MKYADEEVASNIQREFAQFWPVYEGYEIIDGRLCYQGERKYSYAPMVHEELPSELAKLTRGDEAGVLAFARVYGSLGYKEFVPFVTRLAYVGDPLSWIWAHAETIRLCLLLSKALQDDDLSTLNRILRGQQVTARDVEELCEPAQAAAIQRELRGAQHYRGVSSPMALIAERDTVRFDGWNLRDEVTGADKARELFGVRNFRNRMINANIKGMVREIHTGWRTKDRSYWTFTALIETAYWHVANTVDGGKLVRCEECQGVFIQRDNRQRFCPPLFTHPSSKRRHSRCGTRKRVKAHRSNPAHT
jgi:hypothetical protein